MKIPNKTELQQIASNHSSDIKLKELYTTELISFLVSDTTLSSHNPLRFIENILQNDSYCSEKLKTIAKKIGQNDLHRATIEISALSAGNLDKYEFFRRQRCFTGKGLARKSYYNQKIWIFAIKQWVEKADWHCKKQYHWLDKVHRFDNEDDEIINKKWTLKKVCADKCSQVSWN